MINPAWFPAAFAAIAETEIYHAPGYWDSRNVVMSPERRALCDDMKRRIVAREARAATAEAKRQAKAKTAKDKAKAKAKKIKDKEKAGRLADALKTVKHASTARAKASIISLAAVRLEAVTATTRPLATNDAATVAIIDPSRSRHRA